MPRAKSRKVKGEPDIFGSIRKPTAPPTVKFGPDKPKDKHMPSLRKIKHKKEKDLDAE